MAANSAIKDLCTGTERGFKGLSILFFIYGFASLLGCLIISQLTRAHLDYDQENDPEYDGESIRSKCDTLNKLLLSLGCVFWLISAVSALLRMKYKNVKGRSAQGALYLDLDKESHSALTARN